jgi:hypothetical protein
MVRDDFWDRSDRKSRFEPRKFNFYPRKLERSLTLTLDIMSFGGNETALPLIVR